ncbi:MAG: hypothetical protein HY785_00330 [Oscillatoriophycideae cyanobacterium NC_groundwater_1537_Pr4_S-0.65um_50_18]|nr:hypothetical protein [Oscillatoriophycideae cyanobacterium NC_groundwater_1537_Pr4_S-0.65um_50_18]
MLRSLHLPTHRSRNISEGRSLGGVTQHCMEIALFSSVLIERYFRGAIAL